MEIKIMKHDRFGEVRTVMLDDAKYYAGRDVAITLGYNRPDAFLNKHVSKDDKKIVPMRSLSTRVVRNTAVINPNGIHSLCNAACSSFANDILAWLLSDDKTAVPQIVTVEGVSGYIDDKGVAWLSAEDIARECRWVEEQCPVSGCFTSAIRQTKEQPPESGGTSFSIRWARINEYLRELGYDKEVGRGDYLPENIFYRLIWKSRSEYAKKFQSKIADVILPAIRKNGYYISEQAAQGSLFPDEEPVKKIARRPVPELAFVYGLKLSNGLTKIGVAKDLTARMKDLQKETKADVIDWVVSALMTRDEALLLERALKAKFFDYIVSGEFFNVPFEAVKAAISSNFNPNVNKLLEIAREMEPSPEKNSLLIQAAALIS